jgi:hypothetical protein
MLSGWLLLLRVSTRCAPWTLRCWALAAGTEPSEHSPPAVAFAWAAAVAVAAVAAAVAAVAAAVVAF